MTARAWIASAAEASYGPGHRTAAAVAAHEALTWIESLPCTTERDWRECAQLPAGTHDERDRDPNAWNLH